MNDHPVVGNVVVRKIDSLRLSGKYIVVCVSEGRLICVGNVNINAGIPLCVKYWAV